jgi:hypothetical protein
MCEVDSRWSALWSVIIAVAARHCGISPRWSYSLFLWSGVHGGWPEMSLGMTGWLAAAVFASSSMFRRPLQDAPALRDLVAPLGDRMQSVWKNPLRGAGREETLRIDRCPLVGGAGQDFDSPIALGAPLDRVIAGGPLRCERARLDPVGGHTSLDERGADGSDTALAQPRIVLIGAAKQICGTVHSETHRWVLPHVGRDLGGLVQLG